MKDEVAEFAGGLNEVSWITLATTIGTFCLLVSHLLYQRAGQQNISLEGIFPF